MRVPAFMTQRIANRFGWHVVQRDGSLLREGIDIAEIAETVEEFYTADASMQENQSTPRVGRAAHVANERRVMSRVKSLTPTCIRPVFVSGDQVVVRWIFRFEWLDATVTHMEELAGQRREGERIAQETFFYDPAQRIPRKPDTL